MRRRWAAANPAARVAAGVALAAAWCALAYAAGAHQLAADLVDQLAARLASIG